MNWLVGIVLASALAAFAVVNLVKYALAGVTHGIATLSGLFSLWALGRQLQWV